MYAMFGVMLGIAVMTTILFGYLWYKTKKQLKLVNSGSDIAVNEKPPPYEKA